MCHGDGMGSPLYRKEIASASFVGWCPDGNRRGTAKPDDFPVNTQVFEPAKAKREAPPSASILPLSKPPLDLNESSFNPPPYDPTSIGTPASQLALLLSLWMKLSHAQRELLIHVAAQLLAPHQSPYES